MSTNNKKNLTLILKILISFFLFYIILGQVDFNLVIENIKIMNVNYIVLVIFLIILNYLVSSVRWKYLILDAKNKKITVMLLAKFYFIGSFFNNFMPTSMGGDVYKIFALSKVVKSKTNAFTSTFIERFTGMIALVLISYIGLIKTMSTWIDLLPEFVRENIYYVNFVKFSIFVGFWAGTVFAFFLLKAFSNKIGFFKKILDSFLQYKDNKRVILNAILTSFVVQILAILSQYFVFSALSVELPLFHAIAVFPVITLAGFFIPSLNGLGIQDALFIQFFSIVGVSSDVALTASIMYHFSRLFVSLIGGVLYIIPTKSNEIDLTYKTELNGNNR